MMGAVTLSYLATYLMFLMAIVISSNEFQGSIPGFTQSNYSPPLVGFSGINDVSIANKFIFSILAAGIYLSIPGILDSIAKALGVDNPLPEIFKRPFEEFKLGSNYAFRKAPALARATVGRVGYGTAKWALRKAGESGGGTFGDSYAARTADTFARRASQFKSWGAEQGGVLGLIGSGLGSATEVVGEAASQSLGNKAGKVRKVGDEGGTDMAYTVEAYLPGSKQVGKGFEFEKSKMKNSPIEVRLDFSKTANSVPLTGYIIFKSDGSGDNFASKAEGISDESIKLKVRPFNDAIKNIFRKAGPNLITAAPLQAKSSVTYNFLIPSSDFIKNGVYHDFSCEFKTALVASPDGEGKITAAEVKFNIFFAK
jgi:hypothetical protein